MELGRVKTDSSQRIRGCVVKSDYLPLIEEVRRRGRVSQITLSERTGINASTLNRYLKGTREMDDQILQTILDALDIDPIRAFFVLLRYDDLTMYFDQDVAAAFSFLDPLTNAFMQVGSLERLPHEKLRTCAALKLANSLKSTQKHESEEEALGRAFQ